MTDKKQRGRTVIAIMRSDDVPNGFGSPLAGMDATFHAMPGLASRMGAPGTVVVGVTFTNLLAGHALPFAEATFAQTWVELHIQPHEVGEGMRGLLSSEQVRGNDEHAAGRGGRVVDFVEVGQMGIVVYGLRKLVVMFGEMRDFRPIVCFGEFISALVGLPPADDVEGNVDLALQPSCEVVGGASVP